MKRLKAYIHKKRRVFMAYALVFLFLIQAAPAALCQAAEARSLDPDVDQLLSGAEAYSFDADQDPSLSSAASILGLVRAHAALPSGYVDSFHNNVLADLESSSWDLSQLSFSEYARMLLALTATGKDVTAVQGHNLLERLYDLTKVKEEGVEGTAWALLILNSHSQYVIPEDAAVEEVTTQDGLVQYLLEEECTDGGWGFSLEEADTYITSLAIQALAPYYGDNELVQGAIDRGLTYLSDVQTEEGGFGGLNDEGLSETCETNAQVAAALCSLGIHPAEDSRFVKENGSWVYSRLSEYYKAVDSDMGAFVHTFTESSEDGEIDGSATAEALCGLAAYKRLSLGESSLYDMNDVTLSGDELISQTESDTGLDGDESKDSSSDSTEASSDNTEASSDNTESSSDSTESASDSTESPSSDTGEEAEVLVAKLKLSSTKVTLKVGKTKKLTLTVAPSDATNQDVTWKSSNTSVATVSQKGKITAKAVGTAKVTVKAQDGSGEKAVCKVVVKSSSSSSSSSSTSSSSTSSSGSSTIYYRNSNSGIHSTGVTSTGSTVSSGTTSSSTTSSSGTSSTTYSTTGTTGTTDTTGTTTTDTSSSLYSDTSGTSTDSTLYGDSGLTTDSSQETDDASDFEEWEEGEMIDEDGEDEEEDKKKDKKDSEKTKQEAPAWLAVIFGLLSSGGLAGIIKFGI